MRKTWLVIALITSAAIMIASIYFSSAVGKECTSIKLNWGGESYPREVCFNLSSGDSIELYCDTNNSIKLVGLNEGMKQDIYPGQKVIVIKDDTYCILSSDGTVNDGCVLLVCKLTWVTSLFRSVAVCSGLAIIAFMVVLFMELTKIEKYGVNQRIVINDRLWCESRSLTKHRCSYLINDLETQDQLLNKLVGFFVRELGYKVVLREEKFVVLKGKLGEGISSKGIELLMYFPSDDTLLLEFTISGLSASGLLDLKKIVDQIKGISDLERL